MHEEEETQNDVGKLPQSSSDHRVENGEHPSEEPQAHRHQSKPTERLNDAMFVPSLMRSHNRGGYLPASHG
jgi:hypothetical protein